MYPILKLLRTVCFLPILPALSQTPPNAPATAPRQPINGLQAPWDVRKVLSDVAIDNQQLKPVLARLDPQQWYDRQGASSTYIMQWHSAQQQVDGIIAATSKLAQNTENLSLALETYFRLEQLETVARSVQEGAFKYGDRGVAGRLSELIAHNFNSREHFRDYLRDLATTEEQNFRVADAEAQRCRGILTKAPARSGGRSTR